MQHTYIYIYIHDPYIMIYISNDAMQFTFIFWCMIHQTLPVFRLYVVLLARNIFPLLQHYGKEEGTQMLLTLHMTQAIVVLFHGTELFSLIRLC